MDPVRDETEEPGSPVRRVRLDPQRVANRSIRGGTDVRWWIALIVSSVVAALAAVPLVV